MLLYESKDTYLKRVRFSKECDEPDTPVQRPPTTGAGSEGRIEATLQGYDKTQMNVYRLELILSNSVNNDE
jgi:hypothetical protein